MSGFQRQKWEAFAELPAGNYARAIAANELVDMAEFRSAERVQACGADPIQVLVAYAQHTLVYDADGRMRKASAAEYAAAPMENRVNKFGLAYKAGSKIWLHKHLAEICVDVAINMYRAQGWTMVIFDGLRTMEAGYLLYCGAKDEWLQDKLLAPPGKSAHNRALAVDCMLFDANEREVDMGVHFDHTDMKLNRRDYSGTEISEAAKANRLTRERAFLRAALNRDTLVMPLNAEFWHDQVPGSAEDLWRVMESTCRSIGIAAPLEKAHDYAAFAAQWKALDQKKMQAVFGDVALPAADKIMYHECLKPIYDRDLPEPMRLSL